MFVEATPAEHLVVTKAIFYHNYNETLTKVSFEVSYFVFCSKSVELMIIGATRL